MKSNRIALRRSGAALVVAMVCLVVLGVALSTIMQTGAAQHTRLALRARQLQADWLLESAASRAAAQLEADAAFAGETWQPASEEFWAATVAKVMIRVSPSQREPELRQVEIVADLSDGHLPVKRSKIVGIRLRSLMRFDN